MGTGNGHQKWALEWALEVGIKMGTAPSLPPLAPPAAILVQVLMLFSLPSGLCRKHAEGRSGQSARAALMQIVILGNLFHDQKNKFPEIQTRKTQPRNNKTTGPGCLWLTTFYE